MKKLAKKIKNSFWGKRRSLVEKGVKPRLIRKECSHFKNLLHEAEKVKFIVNDNNDTDSLLKLFRRKIQSSSLLYKIGEKIYWEHYECVCLSVKDPFLEIENCSCANDCIKNVFETLFSRPVEVELIKSILKGDGICQQLITIND